MKKNIKISIAQINSKLGDFQYNYEKIIRLIIESSKVGSQLIVFPESALFGYHPFDLLECPGLVEKQLLYLKKIEKHIPTGITAVIGLFTLNKSKLGKPFFNSAAIICKNKKTQFYNKEILPVGDVFDEGRFIEKGALNNNFFKLNNHKVFISICEDIWAWPDDKGRSVHSSNPLTKIWNKNIDLVLNISASPFYDKKIKLRQSVVGKTARHFKAPMVYVNMVGAQDEIIYDGKSFIAGKDGKTLYQLDGFKEQLVHFELRDGVFSNLEKNKKQSSGKNSDLLESLVLGIRDFCVKNRFNKIHLGLSGGIDSALVACLAARAIGPENVTCIALPSQFNDPMSLSLAKGLCENLKMNLIEFSIQDIYQSSKKNVDEIFNIKQFGLVHENLQARIRGLILMAFANNSSSLLLSTSNKSEYAVGYSTLYGDMCGGLAPIGDLTKKQVVDLCLEINKEKEIIPKKIISRPPSAELRPNQKDQDSLPEYDKLDSAVVNIIEKMSKPKGEIEKWTFAKISKTEFKRWQAPPILKVSAHAFGRGRRFPITYTLE